MKRSILNPAPFAGVFLILTIIAAVCLAAIPAGSTVYIAHREAFCGDGGVDTVIQVLRNGNVQINEKIVERNHVGTRLQEIFKGRAERLAYVKADVDVPFRDVATVIDMARGEVNYVALLTPAVETQSGCLTIHLPLAWDINYGKPILEMKEVPLWPW